MFGKSYDKGIGVGNRSTDVNMVQQEEGENEEYDRHYAFRLVSNMEGVHWIIDSGASPHVCYNRNMMVSYSKLLKPVRVHLSSGSNGSLLGFNESE